MLIKIYLFVEKNSNMFPRVPLNNSTLVKKFVRVILLLGFSDKNNFLRLFHLVMVKINFLIKPSATYFC